MVPMPTKLLGILVFAPWLWLGVFDPLIQPLYQGQLIADEHRNQVPVAGLWWVSEVLSVEDSKVTTASCADQSAAAAGGGPNSCQYPRTRLLLSDLPSSCRPSLYL